MLNIKKALTKILRNMPEIRYGYVSAGSVPANAYVDVPITFGSPMKGTPYVFTNMASSSTSPTMGSFETSAIDPSKTGCTVRVFNNTSSARTPGIRYLALYGGGYYVTSFMSTIVRCLGRRWAYVEHQKAINKSAAPDIQRAGSNGYRIASIDGVRLYKSGMGLRIGSGAERRATKCMGGADKCKRMGISHKNGKHDTTILSICDIGHNVGRQNADASLALAYLTATSGRGCLPC